MKTSEAFLGLDCTATGERYDRDRTGRSDADAPLDPVYDYDALGLTRDDVDVCTGDSLWTYDALLPFPADVAVSANEGATPLVDAPSLADELGVGRVVVKDEGRNPTGTVLDRGLSVATTAAVEAGADDVALASTGNSGQSAAAYAGRAELESHSFLPSRSAFATKAMVNVHGGEMRVVGGRFDDAVAQMDELWKDEWYSLQEFTTPYRHEGIKTLAYELLAQLDWDVPDVVIVPASTGEVVVGVEKGLRELRELGLVDDVPAIVAAQAEGCAPISIAWERDIDAPEPWETPDTIVGELEVPDPAGGALALAALDRVDGDAVSIDDQTILESAVVATQRLGIEVGAAGGAAAAAAWALGDDAFDEDDTVAIVNTEAGGKTPDILRSYLMGQGV